MRIPGSLFLALSVSLATPALARDPLIMDGKESLFERVLIRESTQQFDQPGGTGGEALAPLQPLFVYARDGDWLQVGPDDKGETLFWIEESKTTQWRQNIVATFEGKEDMDRVIFFTSEDPVYDILESETPEIPAGEYREEALEAEKTKTQSENIAALGPEVTPDLRRNLYVMPILQSEPAAFESNGADVNVLKVAVARAGATAQSSKGSKIEEVPIQDVPREEYRAGIVFVVDTTISMEPYIKGTEAALKEVYQSFADKGIEDAVSFGLVGYRDSLDAAPNLGYDVRTFVDLQEGSDRDTFFAGITEMTEAKDTSKHFREDAFMGINHALETLEWSEFGARYIVLVTDASPRPANDEFSATGLTPGAMNELVEERLKAVVSVLHLKTERGQHDHATAKSAYTSLASKAGSASLYRPVENGDEAIYRDAARSIGEVATQQVLDFRAGKTDDPGGNAIPDAPEGGDDFTAALQSAGRTMQLAYLGSQSGTEAPDVFEAYVVDEDFTRPGLSPLSIRLLLTKSQLSDLDEAMRLIFEKGEENIFTPDQMFGQILSAAADMSRRPDKVSRNADTTLADAVSVTEMLEGAALYVHHHERDGRGLDQLRHRRTANAFDGTCRQDRALLALQ